MKKDNGKINVAVLGATGTVGQKFIQLLEGHPYFQVSELFASERSSGKTLGDAANWLVSERVPDSARGIKIRSTKEIPESKLVFSALPADIAGDIELRYAKEGKIVISKSSALRYESDVPILVPEINPGHLQLLDVQRKRRGIKGCVITDPNCTTAVLALTLAPLMPLGIEEIHVTTMQALSGAGFPGTASLSIHDNVIPYIGGEEEKVVIESKKILGKYTDGKITEAGFRIFASCNRVPVIDGHTESVHIRFSRKVDVAEVRHLMEKFGSDLCNLNLPSAPIRPIVVRDEPDRPQPRLDRNSGGGMSVTVGRIRQGIDERSVAYTVAGHNTVRGAAGAGILDAEFLVATGMIGKITGENS